MKLPILTCAENPEAHSTLDLVTFGALWPARSFRFGPTISLLGVIMDRWSRRNWGHVLLGIINSNARYRMFHCTVKNLVIYVSSWVPVGNTSQHEHENSEQDGRGLFEAWQGWSRQSCSNQVLNEQLRWRRVAVLNHAALCKICNWMKFHDFIITVIGVNLLPTLGGHPSPPLSVSPVPNGSTPMITVRPTTYKPRAHHTDEIPERDVTYHLTCLLIYHWTTTHLYIVP